MILCTSWCFLLFTQATSEERLVLCLQPKMERSATVSALSSARSATLQRTHTHSSLSAARSMANLHKSRYAQGGKNNLAPRQVLKDRNEETFIAAGSCNMLRSSNLDSVDSNSWQAVS